MFWFTQEAYDKLAEELAYLKGEGRQTVSAKIARARDEGDLSENGGYHAAREEQGQQEARIRQLAAMLENAQVGEPPSLEDGVRPGARVTIYYDGDPDDSETFLLGSRELMTLDDSVDLEVYSPQSPLGQALLGAHKGDAVSYLAPNGKTIAITVADISAN
ncbi:MAG: transcription elongation factor GreA [Propionibacteriaceae bacterium]|jgi:transcription elongation factor GreA|nr:transcription elongation factor GreA [Propionibacteriaceae bacterium]